MTYNCILLKELPNYNVGTEFKIKEFEWCNRIEYYCEFPEDVAAGRGMSYPNYRISRKVIDNPKWVKKEIDEDCLTELKCKKCGSTKMLLEAIHAPYDYDDGVYFYRMKVIGKCTCGCVNEFIEFTTHTKVHY